MLNIIELMENTLRLGNNCKHLNLGVLMLQDICLASLEESGDGATWVWASIPAWQSHSKWWGEATPAITEVCPFQFAHFTYWSHNLLLVYNLCSGEKKITNCASAENSGVYKSLQRTQMDFLPLCLSSSRYKSFYDATRDQKAFQKALPSGPLLYFTYYYRTGF